jgi:hypothetical protein
MMKDILIFSLILSIGFVFIVIGLVRRKLLKEQYSLLWLFFGFMMIILSTNSVWLEVLAKWLDVKYAPALLFFIGIFVCLVLILNVTLVVSKLSERVVKLTQEVGILKHELQKGE